MKIFFFVNRGRQFFPGNKRHFLLKAQLVSDVWNVTLKHERFVGDFFNLRFAMTSKLL